MKLRAQIVTMQGGLAVMVLAAIGCGPVATGPSLRHPPACAAARASLGRWQEAIAAGRLHRALDHARQADAACASPASRQAVAEAWDALGVDARAAAAWRAYAATPGGDGALARARLDALGKRPPPRRDASADERATALLLYRDGVDQRLRGRPDQAIVQLRRSYALLPHPLTIVQIGLAHQAAGRTAEAQAAFERALAIAEHTRGVPAEPRLTPRHAGAVSALVHDATGSLVASGGQDGQVMLWDPSTGRLVRRLDGGPRRVRVADLGFSADRTRVAAAFIDGSVRVWNTVTGELTGKAALAVPAADDLAEAVTRIAPGLETVAIAHADGRLALHGIDGALRATAAASAEGAAGLRFGRDGRRLLQVTDEQIRVFDVDGLRLVREVDRSGDRSLGGTAALTADGASLAVIVETERGADVALLGLADGKQHRLLARGDFAMGEATLELSADGSRMVTTASGGLELWDTVRRRRLRAIGGPGVDLRVAELHPDGDRLVCGDSEGTLRVFDSRTGALVRVIGYDTWGINDVGFDAAGDRLALGSDHGAIQIWDLDGRGRRRQLRGHWGWVVFSQFERRGRRLISAGKDQTIRTWDVATGRQERLTRARLTGKGNQAVAISDDGALVVSVVDNLPRPGFTLRAVDVASGRERVTIPFEGEVHGDGPEPTVVAVDADGRRAAVGFRDRGGQGPAAGPIAIVDLTHRTRPPPGTPAHPAGVTAIAFSPDGRMLATTSSSAADGIRLWQVDGRALAPAGQLAGHQGEHAVELLFLPGNRLASVGRDHKVIVWDLAGARPLFTVDHEAVVTGVTVTPGGRALATSSKDRTVRLWDAQRGAPLGTLMPTRGGDWLVVTPDRRVDGTAGAAELLYWQVGDVQLPGFVAWDRQRRPGLLRTLVDR